MRYLFGAGPAAPCPRFENHYMYMMTTRIQIPIPIGPSGSGIMVVNPLAAFMDNFVAAAYYLPFAITNAASPINPYVSPTSYTALFANASSAMSYAIDACSIEYQCTQSFNLAQGRI